MMTPRAWEHKPSPFDGVPLLEPHEPAIANEALTWPLFRKELAGIASLTVPLSLSNLMGLMISLVAVAFVGRLGSFELSVVVTATSIFNVTGMSVLMGLASAMETLTGQAYGAGRYPEVGRVLQRALLMTALLVVLLGAGWTVSDRLLVLLGQDELISRSARLYLLSSLPALAAQGAFEVLKRYLMAQECARPVTAATLLGLVTAPAFNWLLVRRLDFRLLGAAAAMDCVGLVMAGTLGAYVWLRDRKRAGHPRATWHGWSRQALEGWGGYLRYAAPSVAMICCEWWTFEAVILLAGRLADPATALSAMGIAIDTTGAQFMLLSGVSMSLSTRTAHALGAGAPRVARRAVLAAVALAVALETGVAVLLLATRASWPLLFTDVPAVVATTTDLMLLVVATLPGDMLNNVLQGLLRGAGKQELGAVTNIISYWGMGIPMAAYLGLGRGMGLRGLWWGLVFVNTLQGVIMITITCLLDLDKIAAQVVARFEARASARSSARAAARVADVTDVTEPLLAVENGGANATDP